jgi:hypothetical protein
VRLNRRFWIFACAWVSCLTAGCWLGKTPYGPLERIEPPPARLGQALAALEEGERCAEVSTCLAQGDLTFSAEGMRGKTSVQSNLLYATPDRLRFRASYPLVGLVFEILQTGPAVQIKLNREGRIFRGTARELAEHPELIGGLEPLEVIWAFLVGQRLLEAVEEQREAGLEPDAVPFKEDLLVFSRQVPSPGGSKSESVEEYDIRREDGLIQEVRVYDSSREKRRKRAMPRLTVRYSGWGLKEGRLYPRKFEIHSRHPDTRLKIKVDKAQFDLFLQARVFQMDTEGFETLPLEELFLPRTDVDTVDTVDIRASSDSR